MVLALEDHRGTIGFAASGGLHLVVVLLLLLSVSRAPPPAVHDRDPIEIEILSGDEAAPVAAPDRAKPPDVPSARPPDLAARPPADQPGIAPPLTGPPPTVPPGWTTAPRLFSPHAFALPGNRAVHRHILAMPADLRDEQLCDFEAMEQVARTRADARPDQVVAYALADTRTEGRALVAEGAAIRLAGQWFRLAFRCEVAPRDAVVTAFAFRLGEAIPRRLWNEHGLAAGGDD